MPTNGAEQGVAIRVAKAPVPPTQLAGTWQRDLATAVPPDRNSLYREVTARPGTYRIVVDPPDAWLGIVAAGHVAEQVLDTLGVLGVDRARAADLGIRLLKLDAGEDGMLGGPRFDRLYVTGGDPGCLFRLDVNVPGLRLLPARRPRPPRGEKG